MQRVDCLFRKRIHAFDIQVGIEPGWGAPAGMRKTLAGYLTGAEA